MARILKLVNIEAQEGAKAKQGTSVGYCPRPMAVSNQANSALEVFIPQPLPNCWREDAELLAKNPETLELYEISVIWAF